MADELKKDTKKKSEDKSVEKTPKKVNENKIVRNLILISVAILILVLAAYLFLNSQKNFNYHGLKFKTVAYGNLIFYQTSFPVIHQGNETPYNVYFRTKPSRLEKINFDTEGFDLMKYNVLNVEGNLSCNGDGVIAIANLVNVVQAIGMTMMTDENASCDESGRYTYLTIRESNVSSIEKVGNHCYNINIKNCEILPLTEKYTVETILKFIE